jgi:hypothetical protein
MKGGVTKASKEESIFLKLGKVSQVANAING